MKSIIKRISSSILWIAKDTKKYIVSLIVIIILGIMSSLSSVAMAIISRSLVDNAMSGNIRLVLYYAIAFGFIIIINLGMNALSSTTAVRTQEGFSNTLRQRMFGRISGAEWSQISKYHSGDILTRLTSDIGTVASGVVDILPSIISLGAQLIAAFITLLIYAPYLAVLAFVFGPLTVLLSRIWGRKLKKYHKKIQESESAYRSFIQESVENITIVKAFRMEERNIKTISSLHNERMGWVLKRNRTGIAANSILALGYWVSYFIAFGWGALQLAKKTITYGTLTAFIQLIGQIQGPFIGLSRTLPQIIATLGSAERLMELEELEIEKDNQKLDFTESVGIHLQNVSFSYNREDNVVSDATFKINPGEIVALTGPSGEGKTTIIRLLLAFLKPISGSVVFFDVNGAEYKASASTRDWIAYVPQGNTLFSGTISDNIRSGFEEATEEDLIEAAKISCAWEFIKTLPNGLNTVIGENGLGLSEGQAQRIALARAIVRKAPVLILDESTSALDMDLEMRVLEGIKNLKPSRSCLVITHRLSALQICSKVLSLKNGIIRKEPVKNITANGAFASDVNQVMGS